MRVTLVCNPNAGNGEHTLADVAAMLRRAGMTVNAFTTDELKTSDILDHPTDLFAAAGGDGTVKKVATGLVDRRTPFAIVPLGTANNIARSLGISGDPESIVKRWHNGRVRRYDVGLAMGPWGTAPFVEAVGVGALAETLSLERERHDSSDARISAGRKEFVGTLQNAEPLETVVTIDGTPTPGDWLLIEILNLSHSGPSLSLAPAADPSDGALDVLCIREEHRRGMLRWLEEADNTPPPVEPIRAARVAFNWGSRHRLRVDDDLVEGPPNGRPHPVTINLQPIPLNILLPGRSAEARYAPSFPRWSAAKQQVPDAQV
jgi:diacylglycerol kinase (ATP)